MHDFFDVTKFIPIPVLINLTNTFTDVDHIIWMYFRYETDYIESGAIKEGWSKDLFKYLPYNVWRDY